MALAAVTIWTAGQTLTAAALNAEFANIRNNALALLSPLTGNMDLAGFSLLNVAAGTIGTPAIYTTGDTNTGVYFPAVDAVSLVTGGSALLALSLESTRATVKINQSAGGAVGPILTFLVASSPTVVGDIAFVANDTGSIARTVGLIRSQFDDATQSSIDSHMVFGVSNAVNANDVNTFATLSGLGVWTDASAAAGKDYIGDVVDVCGKMRDLKLGVYVGKGAPESSERHFSATAEDFYKTFGLGRDPADGDPGIAAKDVAWLAVRMCQELEERLWKTAQ